LLALSQLRPYEQQMSTEVLSVNISNSKQTAFRWRRRLSLTFSVCSTGAWKIACPLMNDVVDGVVLNEETHHLLGINR
jgi:hypothetical protein